VPSSFTQKARLWLVAFFISLMFCARAGEFPDSWTWDDEVQVRNQHAALEGKPMPALDLVGCANGQIKPQT